MNKALIVAGLALAIAFSPSVASAQEFGPDDAIRELDESRALLEDSVRLYEAGDHDRAYEAALSAYLDHFEFVEIPLRVRDEALTLELEEDFAILRNQIESRAPPDAVRDIAIETQRGLDRVERRLSEAGIAAPVVAGVSAFVILFREGLEAVLIVAAILGYLEASRNLQYRRPVLNGVALAVAASAVTFVAITAIVNVAPVQRELLEAVMAALAVVVLFYVSFWLVARLEQRRWMEFVKSKVWAAATTGSTLALAGVGFTAVYREGFETALFYQALVSFAEGLEGWVALGSAVAAATLGAIGMLIFKAGRRIPVKPFLTSAVVVIMALSVAFMGNAVRAFQTSATISTTFLESFPRLPIFLADLTGWHPTRETILAQAILTAVYIAGGVWTFLVLPRRGRRRAIGDEEIVAAKPDRREVTIEG